MKMKKRILSFLLCIVMLVGLLPAAAFAYWEEPSAEGDDSLEKIVYDYEKPVGVTMKPLTGSCVTETDNLGDDLLFVIKSGGRYYAMRDIGDGTCSAIPAVDVTDWVNADGTLTVPADTLDVAFWRYESRPVYELAMFIAGSENYLSYTYDYKSADGDDDNYNDAERTYWADFEIVNFTENQWITVHPYYWSENGVSGTLKFNGSWNQRISSYNYKQHNYSMIVDLRNDGIGGQEFYFRYLGTDVEYTGEEVEGYLYYADCRHQYTVRHAEYDAPTCMLKGCEEYWYCEGCDEYYKDEALTELWGEYMPVIPATGHDWGTDSCANCGRPVPVYSKVTNMADFNALADDTMFILVAEYNGKYYVPDLSGIYLYMMDSNGDGYMDIHDIDDNGNGTPDYLEFDEDGDGVYDYLTWDMDGDGDVDEEDHFAFSEMICRQHLTDMLYGSFAVGAAEVTMNPDGTFSHEAVEATIEFEMVDYFSDADIDWMLENYEDFTEENRWTAECVKQYVIPNYFVTAPSFALVERQYRQERYDTGDAKTWAMLFYDDMKSNEFVEMRDIACDGSVMAIPAWLNFYMPEYEDETTLLRMRDYNGQITFVTGYDYELEGVEYVDDENGGYLETHDTQAAVYLYASQAPAHVCVFENWVDDGNGRTHTGTCECGETKTEDHGWDKGTQTKAPTCTDEGVMTFTCTGCGATRTEAIDALGHDWSDWTYHDEESHVHTCNRGCGAEAQYEAHQWGDWIPAGENEHKKTCDICSGEHTGTHTWDTGVVTQAPTHTEEGVMTYTCTLCGYSYEEDIPTTDEHQWSQWGSDNDDTHSRSCPCGETQTEAHDYDDGTVTQAPTHVAEGEIVYTCGTCNHEKREALPKLEDHEWGQWVSNEDGTHSRRCICGETETADCAYGEGVQTEAPTHTEEGVMTYTCTLCGHSYDEGIPVLTEHAWGEWIPNEDDNTTHIRFCVCNESQTAPHNFDEGKVMEEPTHTEPGVRVYTCGDCGYSYEEEIPVTPDHEWSVWKAKGDGTHSRYCNCGEEENEACVFDDGVQTKEATHTEEGVMTYTCGVCKDSYEESIPMLTEHVWGEWIPDENDHTAHVRTCECGESETAPHSWSQWTLQDDGSNARVCSDCGKTETITFQEDKPINTTPGTNDLGAELEEGDQELFEDVLTEEDKEDMAQGAEVSVYLVVEDITDQVPADHKAAAEAHRDGAQIAMYLNIDLFKKVDDTVSQIRRTSGPVTITIEIPASLLNNDEDVTRTYHIIRVHEEDDGTLVTEIIQGVFKEEDGTFTFETDRFSTYALAYIDKVKAPEPVTPPTGDTAMVGLWMGLLVLNALAVAAAFVGKKRAS